MWLRSRKKHRNWKKREMMHSKEESMKLPRNFILKHLKWILTRDHFGPIEQFVETSWRNMKMLWQIACPHFPLIQNALRRAFKLILAKKTLLWASESLSYQSCFPPNWHYKKAFTSQLLKKEMLIWVCVNLMKPKSVMNHYANLEKNLLPTSTWRSSMIFRKRIRCFGRFFRKR